MSIETKLVQLRKKTDRDLLILVRRELERSLALADVAATKQSPLYARAERGYEMVKTLLPRIADLTQMENRELRAKVKELQAALDRFQQQQVFCCSAGASGAE